MTKLTEQQIYERLLTLRDSADAIIRKQARRELLESDSEFLIGILSKIMKVETNTEILAYAAEIIVESDIKQKANLILPLLQSSDALLRRHICGLLGNCGDKVATDHLTDRLLTDASPDVRVVAAYALGRIGDVKALPALTWAKDHDTSSDFQGIRVSEQAIKAIDEIERKQPH